MKPEQRQLLDDLDQITSKRWQEFWWIYSPVKEEWAGLRFASFTKAKPDDIEVLVIFGEIDRRRVGLRVWEDIRVREHWVKVAKIPIPTMEAITLAVEADLIKR